MTTLEAFGWDPGWQSLCDERNSESRYEPGRVTAQSRDRWQVQLASGATTARIASASFPGPYPLTGDWVLVEPGPAPHDPVSIVSVLPRRTALSRGAAGTSGVEQVLAPNVDVVWIVESLDGPPNLRRLERFLAVVWESDATPEIVLTKADLVSGYRGACSWLSIRGLPT